MLRLLAKQPADKRTTKEIEKEAKKEEKERAEKEQQEKVPPVKKPKP